MATLPKETYDKIIELRKRSDVSEQINEQKQTNTNATTQLLRMYPIPEYQKTLLYYKIDLMVFEDNISLNLHLRTESSVTYNFNNEDSTMHGSKGFISMKGNIRYTNQYNHPSNVISDQMYEHPFYIDMKQKRKDLLKKYKDKDMVIQPYMTNFHMAGKKNEGTYDFSNAIVALEENNIPEVYIRIADWEFHQHIPLYSEKIMRGKNCLIYTVKESIRDFNPKRRSLV